LKQFKRNVELFQLKKTALVSLASMYHSSMRSFRYGLYRDLLENTSDPILRAHMRAEIFVLENVRDPSHRTFVDLGAGYGRLIPQLAGIAGNVIAIDIHPDMYPELESRCAQHPNCVSIRDNLFNLPALLTDLTVTRPVFLLMQNTLGTIEGKFDELIRLVWAEAVKSDGEMIVSLFRQESLGGWGMTFYSGIAAMAGEPDLERTNLPNGLYVSQTGYSSKWWASREIRDIQSLPDASTLLELWTPYYCILHLSKTKVTLSSDKS
jgi:SAM-dependent methyltransferase